MQIVKRYVTARYNVYAQRREFRHRRKYGENDSAVCVCRVRRASNGERKSRAPCAAGVVWEGNDRRAKKENITCIYIYIYCAYICIVTIARSTLRRCACVCHFCERRAPPSERCRERAGAAACGSGRRLFGLPEVCWRDCQSPSRRVGVTRHRIGWPTATLAEAGQPARPL